MNAEFWPHTADRPLSEIEPIGQKRLLLASYVLYAILRHRALKLTEAPIYVAREDENGDFEAVPHPLDDLFREPNPDQDWQDLSIVTQMLMDLDGRALWLKNRDVGERVRMVDVFHDGEFSVRSARTEDGVRRLYGRFDVPSVPEAMDLGPDDVVFWRIPHPYDRYETTSPTDAVASMLGVGKELLIRVRAMIENAAAPGGFFSLPAGTPRMGDEEFKESAERLRGEYRNVRTGNAGLLEGGMTFESIGWMLGDVQFGPLWREIEAACCAAFHVRPEILGFLVGLENAPWSHMATARRLSYEEGIIPLWRTWERTLTRQLLTPEDRDQGIQIKYDLSRIPALQDDLDKKTRIAVRLGDDLSINERRIAGGWEPTDNPEHDEVRGRVDRMSGRSTEPEPTTEQRGRVAPYETKHRLTEEEKAQAWKQFDAFARTHEALWESEVLPLLDDDKAWALRFFNDGVKAWYKLKVKEDLDARVRRLMAMLDREYNAHRLPTWQTAMGAVVARTARASAEGVAERLGVSFDLMIPGVDRYAERHAAEMVTQVSGTTKDRIRGALGRGLREGEDIPTIAGRIQESGAFAESRATLIARTEVTTVSNRSQIEGLQEYAEETGERVHKTWVATRDDRTREEHMEMDGVEVDINDTFNTPDLGPVQGPEAPNCRCTVVMRIEREGDS